MGEGCKGRGGEERDCMSDLIDRDKTLEAIQKHFNPSGEERSKTWQ